MHKSIAIISRLITLTHASYKSTNTIDRLISYIFLSCLPREAESFTRPNRKRLAEVAESGCHAIDS